MLLPIRSYSFDGIPPGTAVISDAWEKKFNQAYQKSKIFFGETAEFQKMDLLYREKTAAIGRVKKQTKHITALGVCAFVLFWIIMFVVIMANQA